MSGFTKLFSTIIHSTIWRADMHVKVVWVTMLAMADQNGRVWASVPGLADASRVSLPQCIEALQVLSSPDEWSRTQTNEGRRIVTIDGGWELLNYLKYREARNIDERREQTRRAVAKHRAKARVSPVSSVSKVSRVSRSKPKQKQKQIDQNHKITPAASDSTRRERPKPAHKVLVRLAHDVLDEAPPDTPDSELCELLKEKAAPLKLDYDSGAILRALDAARAQRGQRPEKAPPAYRPA